MKAKAAVAAAAIVLGALGCLRSANASGTVDADLIGDGGKAHVIGSWSCAG